MRKKDDQNDKINVYGNGIKLLPEPIMLTRINGTYGVRMS